MRFNMHLRATLKSGLKRRLQRLPLKSSLSTSIAAVVVLSGCGKFGKNPEPTTTLEFQAGSTHCMESFSENVRNYLKAEISQTEWSQKFDCILNHLEQFEKEVQPSDQSVEPGNKTSGYTAQDVQTFFTRFVMKDERVSAELMSSAFSLKSVLFGGSADRVSGKDLAHIKNFIRSIQKETTDLLPYLKNRDFETAERIERAFTNLSRQFYIPYQRMFQKQDLYIILKELFRLKEIHLHPGDLELIGRVKEVFIGGSPDLIEPEAWHRVFKLLGGVAGLYHTMEGVDFKSDPFTNSPHRNYVHNLVLKLSEMLKNSVGWHGGGISLVKLNGLIDVLPVTTLDPFNRRKAVSGFLRTMVERFFQGKRPGSLDEASVNNFTKLFSRWVTRQNLIQKLFDEYKLPRSGVSKDKLVSSIRDLSGKIDKAQVKELASLLDVVMKFKPIYPESGIELALSRTYLNSYHNFTIMSLINMLIEQFSVVYGNPKQQYRLTEAEFSNFFKDVLPFGVAFQFFDPHSPNIAERHFGNMNLFTWASNGDSYLDPDEIAYYLPMVLSAKSLSQRFRDIMEPECGLGAYDDLGWEWVDADCFRRTFIAHRSELLDHFPEVLEMYDRGSPEEQLTFIKNLEKIARKYGYTQEPLASNDIDSVAMVFNYVDSVFVRFDKDLDKKLNLNEIVSAFPLFKSKLVSVAGDKVDPNDEETLLAALTYTLNYGVAPNGDNASDGLHFLKWKNISSWDHLIATRFTLYQLLASIVKPETPPKIRRR